MEKKESARKYRKLPLHIFAALILAGAVTAALPAAAGEDDLVAHIAEGRQAFIEVCGACHGIDKPEKKDMERPAWDELITSMEGKGAKLTVEERELILDYLGIRNIFLTKCTTCHTTERILDRKQPFAAWEATVTKMSQKGPGLVSDGEARSIIAYLTAIRGVESPGK